MKINIKKYPNYEMFRIGDVIEPKTGGPYVVVKIPGKDIGYALLSIENSCFANGCFDSLSSLTHSVVSKDWFKKHYSCNEYELILTKKVHP